MKKSILSFIFLLFTCHVVSATEVSTCVSSYSSGSEFEYCERHKGNGETVLTQRGSLGRMYAKGWRLISTLVAQRDEYSKAKLIFFYFER